MWNNIVEPDRIQVTIWLMRIACWITKTTNKHSNYVILNCFSTEAMITRTRFKDIACPLCPYNQCPLTYFPVIREENKSTQLYAVR